MTNSLRTWRAIARVVLLGAAVAGLGFSCDKSVNDGDVALLVTIRASLGDVNQQGGGDVLKDPERIVSVSSDGRYVAFASKAENLVSNDGNGDADIFRRDMIERTTVLVSVNRFTGDSGNGPSGSPSISADGRYVAFTSIASDLHEDDPDGIIIDVFVRDMDAQTTHLVSRQSGDGLRGDGNSFNPSISGNGQYVVFETLADNLDGFDGAGPTGGPDQDGLSDIYRRDVLGFGNQTILISRAAGVDGVKGAGASNQPRCSFFGNFVVFDSLAANLVVDFVSEGGDDTNNNRDVFVRDVGGNAIRRVSVTVTGGQTTGGASDTAAISADGRFIAYRSNASNIHPDDDGPENDIFLYDRTNGAVIICSQHTFGTQAGNFCTLPVITGDGRFVVFQSEATSLVNGDSNSRTDVFRHDRVSRETIRVTVSTYGGQLNGHSLRPEVSADGAYIAFVSDATNAADDDSNGAVDVYLRGPPR